jgi:hypothetical protein
MFKVETTNKTMEGKEMGLEFDKAKLSEEAKKYVLGLDDSTVETVFYIMSKLALCIAIVDSYVCSEDIKNQVFNYLPYISYENDFYESLLSDAEIIYGDGYEEDSEGFAESGGFLSDYKNENFIHCVPNTAFHSAEGIKELFNGLMDRLGLGATSLIYGAFDGALDELECNSIRVNFITGVDSDVIFYSATMSENDLVDEFKDEYIKTGKR